MAWKAFNRCLKLQLSLIAILLHQSQFAESFAVRQIRGDCKKSTLIKSNSCLNSRRRTLLGSKGDSSDIGDANLKKTSSFIEENTGVQQEKIIPVGTGRSYSNFGNHYHI